MEENALQSAILQLKYYKSLGDNTFAQLTESEIHWTADPSQNSIAIIVNHLTGNMLSRWTNIFEEDGEKDWRNRDQEFEAILKTKASLQLDAAELFGAYKTSVKSERNISKILVSKSGPNCTLRAPLDSQIAIGRCAGSCSIGCADQRTARARCGPCVGHFLCQNHARLTQIFP